MTMHTKFHWRLRVKPDIYALSMADLTDGYPNDPDWRETCHRLAGKVCNLPCLAVILDDGRCAFDIFCDQDNWQIKPDWVDEE
jgi:hypothetical protein